MFIQIDFSRYIGQRPGELSALAINAIVEWGRKMCSAGTAESSRSDPCLPQYIHKLVTGRRAPGDAKRCPKRMLL